MTQQRLKTQVLVIGAGISGSTSALTLADAGYEVTLIVPEKSWTAAIPRWRKAASSIVQTLTTPKIWKRTF